jgi:hypothetical protein
MNMHTRIAICLVALVGGCYNPDIKDSGFTCQDGQSPACPDGFSCVGGVCTKGGGSPINNMPIMIPKTGAPYSGPKLDPMLSDASKCPDNPAMNPLEPNDTPAEALQFTPMPDMPTQRIINMAICPTGPAPWSGQHDVDMFQVKNTNGSLSLVAQVFYDISYGDLDIGIYDASLNPLSVDGTQTKDGCVAAQIQNGTYYVVVVGANNVDANRYQLLIRSYTMPHACTGSTGADGGA